MVQCPQLSIHMLPSLASVPLPTLFPIFAIIFTHHAHVVGSLSFKTQAIVTTSEKPTSSWDWKTNNLKAKSVVMPPHPFVYLSFFWVGDVHKFENIYFLALYRKGFLTPALKSHSTWFLDCEVKFGPLLVHFLGF